MIHVLRMGSFLKRILHLSHTEIDHDGRILKEMRAASHAAYDVAAIGIYLNEGTTTSTLAQGQKITTLKLRSKRWRFLPSIFRHLFVFLEFSYKSFFLGKGFKPDLIHCNDTLVLPLGCY